MKKFQILFLFGLACSLIGCGGGGGGGGASTQSPFAGLWSGDAFIQDSSVDWEIPMNGVLIDNRGAMSTNGISDNPRPPAYHAGIVDHNNPTVAYDTILISGTIQSDGTFPKVTIITDPRSGGTGAGSFNLSGINTNGGSSLPVDVNHITCTIAIEGTGQNFPAGLHTLHFDLTRQTP